MNKFIKYVKEFFTDPILRRNALMLFGFLFNGSYIVINLNFGILNADPWLITAASFYLLFASVRYTSIDSDGSSFDEDAQHPYSVGLLMILVSFPISGMIFYAADNTDGREYSGILLFALSLYFIYSLVRVIRYIIHIRKGELGFVLCNVRLLGALISFYNLQLFLLPSFLSEPRTIRAFNFISGSFVALSFFTVSIVTFLKCRAAQRSSKGA